MASRLTNSGSGYGSGYGYGYGEEMGSIAGHKVRRTPWGVFVGCQSHSLETWRVRWREIAEECDVQVDEEEVAEWLERLDSWPAA